MKYALWTLVVILILAHQDFWYWDDGTLVFGFLPIGLFYHVCLSLAAGLVWWLACVFAWPKLLEESTLDEIEESNTTISSQRGHEA